MGMKEGCAWRNITRAEPMTPSRLDALHGCCTWMQCVMFRVMDVKPI